MLRKQPGTTFCGCCLFVNSCQGKRTRLHCWHLPFGLPGALDFPSSFLPTEPKHTLEAHAFEFERITCNCPLSLFTGQRGRKGRHYEFYSQIPRLLRRQPRQGGATFRHRHTPFLFFVKKGSKREFRP